MKTLLLMRHGKSSWQQPGLRDHERPLIAKGQERTERVADYIQQKGLKPELIISSHATRSFNTAVIVSEILDYPRHEILVESNVYHGATEDLYNLVLSLPNVKESVLIIGHNPVITQLANEFIEQKLDYLPTSGLVAVRFESTAWEHIPMAQKTLLFTVSPKSLKDQ